MLTPHEDRCIGKLLTAYREVSRVLDKMEPAIISLSPAEVLNLMMGLQWLLASGSFSKDVAMSWQKTLQRLRPLMPAEVFQWLEEARLERAKAGGN